MSLCKYAYYKNEEKYCPRLYCRAKDDKMCHYTKRCMKVDKFIPIEDNIWEECGIYIMEKRKEIPNGAYFVQTKRLDKKGNLFLYVVINDKVEKILTNFKELKQDYVYLKETRDGYNVSLEPFKKNNNITIHINEELLEERKEEKKKSRKKFEPTIEAEEDE